jgi:hypothetical protein
MVLSKLAQEWGAGSCSGEGTRVAVLLEKSLAMASMLKAGVALEMTGGEERSLHCASAKGADAPVGMTDRGKVREALALRSG